MNKIDRLNKYLTFSETHLKKSDKNKPPLTPCITLSRMPGCQGNTIAYEVAEKLNHKLKKEAWQVYNKSLLSKILEQNNWPPEYRKYLEATHKPSLQSAIEESLGLHPSYDLLQKKCNDTILGLGDMGYTIIVGRGSNFILANRPATIHIRLVGSFQHRVEQVKKTVDLSPATALEYLKKQDASREKFIRTWFKKDINSPLNYTCMINTDSLSTHQVAEIIIKTLSQVL